MKPINLKHLLASLVALLAVLPSWSADGYTFYAYTVEGLNMTFKVISENEKTCQVENCVVDLSYSGSITIPSSVNGYLVTSIREYAFEDCSGLTSINIPEGVTSIGITAFQGCSGLSSITIPSSVTSIGDYVFRDCSSLTSITIPEGVTSIGNFAFNGCTGLSSITIPSSVTSIGGNAFSGCTSLESAIIPSTVTYFGERVFSGCSNLSTISLPSVYYNKPTINTMYMFEGCTSLPVITSVRDKKVS